MQKNFKKIDLEPFHSETTQYQQFRYLRFSEDMQLTFISYYLLVINYIKFSLKRFLKFYKNPSVSTS